MGEQMNTAMNVVEKLEKSSSKDQKIEQAAAENSRSQSCEPLSYAQQRKEYKDQLKHSESAKTPRSRAQSKSVSIYFTEDLPAHPTTSLYMKDRVLTENAKYLTPEQMRALEIDIFKPLDFYEILFDRMKARDNGEGEEEPGEYTVMDWQDFKMNLI